jgi:ATP/maltotriose-dependent transcriptional regulator MalT
MRLHSNTAFGGCCRPIGQPISQIVPNEHDPEDLFDPLLWQRRELRIGDLGRADSHAETPLTEVEDSPLTAREREVLQLAAEGRSTREIAQDLFVSPGTVKTHFHHIYEKLGVGCRASAVAKCLRSGLIE